MTFHWCDMHALQISNLVVFHEKKINFLAGNFLLFSYIYLSLSVLTIVEPFLSVFIKSKMVM